MSDTLAIGLGAAGAAVSQGLGMMNQGQQVKDQMGLMEHGANLAYRNWLRTNYGAQREQLEKAGMNVGLMYSQGGQGGQLNGGNSGSASSAPTFDVASSISQARAVESQLKLATSNVGAALALPLLPPFNCPPCPPWLYINPTFIPAFSNCSLCAP